MKAILVNAQGCEFDSIELTSIKAIKEWARGRGGKYHVVVMHGEERIEFNVRTTAQPAPAVETEAVEVETTQQDFSLNKPELETTVRYTAKPSDSRCAWWSVQLPVDIKLNDQRIPAPYLRKGADLELKQGDMLIDSEAMHHRKNRGYQTGLIVCVNDDVEYLLPTAQRKAFIKANGGQDLMHESGDVAGCVRMAVWLRRQPDLSAAVHDLQNCN